LFRERKNEGKKPRKQHFKKIGENRKKNQNLEKVKIAKIHPALPMECTASWEGYERVVGGLCVSSEKAERTFRKNKIGEN